MTYNKEKTAEQLKCIIIDNLLQLYPNIIIGNEVMFGSTRNAVDLLAIQNNKMIAIIFYFINSRF